MPTVQVRISDVRVDTRAVAQNGVASSAHVVVSAGDASVEAGGTRHDGDVTKIVMSLPLSWQHFAVVGVVLVLLGLGLGLVLGGATLVSFLLNGGFLIPGGIGVLALSAVKRHFEQTARFTEARRVEEIAAADSQRLRALLKEPRAIQTIEWLAAQSGLPVAAVVRALAFLRAKGVVVEELNSGTGDWFYFEPIVQPGLGIANDLDARLQRLDPDRSQR